MEEDTKSTTTVGEVYINNIRLMSNILKSYDLYRFCMGLAKSSRVTPGIIKRLKDNGIDE